jgi:RNA polymerase sigma-70 factor (ECF subfamily)
MARSGDREALATLWRTHQPRLLRYVRARGVADADDVATQVWIDAARNIARFRGDGDDFRRWLFTIAHRRVVDERRRAGRRREAALPAASPSPGADTAFDEQDSLARAIALVKHLADPMREAVLLRIVADLSVDDTARVMGLRAGHVRVLVHRGLRRLEALLGDQRHAVTDGDAPTMERST